MCLQEDWPDGYVDDEEDGAASSPVFASSAEEEGDDGCCCCGDEGAGEGEVTVDDGWEQERSDG